MRKGLASLILLGGILSGGVCYGNELYLPDVVFAVLAGLLCGAGYLLFTAVYSGKLWGIRIKSSRLSKIKIISSALMIFLGGFSLAVAFMSAFVSLVSFELVSTLIVIGVFIVSLLIGVFAAQIFAKITLAKEKGAAVLSQLSIFEEVDKELDQAVNFVVGFEGVALFSATDYCYAIFRYTDYQLGELTTVNEVGLVGTYFVQRYSDRFDFKVDIEVIPGEPGRTVVAVGTGGIGIARIQGTPDKRLFRSYIFTRKK